MPPAGGSVARAALGAPMSIVPGAAWRRTARASARWRGPGRTCTAQAPGPSRSAPRPRCAARAPTTCDGCWGRSSSPTSSSTRVVSAATSERSPPISPAIEVGALGVLDHDHLPVERPRLPVERLHLLAVVRAAHGQARAGDAIEVEGVQRLAGQQHRVVGDVDDVVDRPLPGRDSLAFSHGGDGAIVTSSNTGGEAGHSSGHSTRPRARHRARRAPGLRSTAPARAVRRWRHAARGRRRRPEAVGTVRRDLELEHLGARSAAPRPAACRGRARRRGSARRARGSRAGAGRRSRARTPTGSSLRRRRRGASPSSACVPSGITAPGRATATVCPAATLGAPQTIVAALLLAEVDGADLQPVGVGMLLGLEHPADDEPSVDGTP